MGHGRRGGRGSCPCRQASSSRSGPSAALMRRLRCRRCRRVLPASVRMGLPNGRRSRGILKGLYGPGYSEFGYFPGVPIRDDSTFSILQSSSCAGPAIRQEAGSFVVVLLPVTTVDRPPGAAFGQTDRDGELLDVHDVRQLRFGETQDGERAARCRLSPAARLSAAPAQPPRSRPPPPPPTPAPPTR